MDAGCMAKIYQVKLTAEQRQMLQSTVNKGSAKAQRQRRARTLLLADAGRRDQAIAAALQIGRATVERTRRRFFEEGLEAALSRRVQARPSRRPKLDGQAEAHRVALACSTPPGGHARRTLRRLADRLVVLEVVAACSHETVRQTLKKRAQAVAEAAMGHPARGQRRVCGLHGRRAGSLHPAR